MTESKQIYKCKKPCSGDWEIINGRLKQIDGGVQYVYGVNRNNDVFTRPVNGSGEWRHISGQKLTYVTVSAANYIYGVDANGSSYRCPKPCYDIEFESLDLDLVRTFDAFIGVNQNGDIYVYDVDV